MLPPRQSEIAELVELLASEWSAECRPARMGDWKRAVSGLRLVALVGWTGLAAVSESCAGCRALVTEDAVDISTCHSIIAGRWKKDRVAKWPSGQVAQ